MNFQGRIVHCRAAEEKITVQQAVVNDERLSIDWNQDGRPGYLIAKSVGGSQFQGRYGYQQEKSDYECELTLFKADHEMLLLGTWRDPNTALKGTLIVRLPAGSIESRPQKTPRSAGNESAIERGTAAVTSGAKRSAVIAPVARSQTHPAGAAVSAAAVLPKAVPARPLPSSTQVDHLLSITADEFAARNPLQIEQELMAAPVSALFKVAHNALAPDLKDLAARMFAERYTSEPSSARPAVAPRRTESPEMRAQKRRSSRHGRSREPDGD